ncbi:hypothetical protein Pst134EB_014785 [Puccinia striiformis f. sp. tritici]|nr:hypothetical protein Pst134EB_014785 [Puccinia striiformis f. sp. tritici]
MGSINDSFETLKPHDLGLFHGIDAGVSSLTFAVSIPESQQTKNEDSKHHHDERTSEDATIGQNSNESKLESIDLKKSQFVHVTDPLATPENFSWRKKWFISLLVLSLVYANAIFSSLVSTLGTKIEGELRTDFSIGMKGLNVPLSIFNLGNGIGPLFLAPLSERYGRVPVMRLGWLTFVILNAGCGFARSQAQLFLLRFLAGFVVAGPITLSQVILAEMWGRENRGTPCCLNSLVVVVGPSIGNLLGGWTVDRLAWRWTFWGSSSISLILLILVILFLPETNKTRLPVSSGPPFQIPDLRLSDLTMVDLPHLSDQKSDLESVLDSKISSKTSSSTPPHEKSKTLDEFLFTRSNFVSRLIPLPLWIFFNDPMIFILSIQMGMIYSLFYTVQTRIVSLYHHDLNESIQMSSLHVLSLSLGAICASKINTRGLSAICDRLGIVSERSRDRPEYKLRCMVPGILLLPLGTFCFGLITNLKSSWLVPDIGLFFLGAGVIFGFRKAGSYIIDTFGEYAASALAGMHLIRRIESFMIPVIINLTIKSRLKYELILLGFTLSSLIFVCPTPFLLFIYGPRIRRSPLSGK